MSYTFTNYKTKKALKDAVATGEVVQCYQPGLRPNLSDFTGKIYLEGPHYPEAHKWYAEAWMENGVVVKVK